MTLDFDAVVIGSSPLAMFEALSRARSGMRVAVLERSSSIGGVWGSKAAFGVADLELYCHVMTRDTAGYDALRYFFPKLVARLEFEPVAIQVQPGSSDVIYRFDFRSIASEWRAKGRLAERPGALTAARIRAYDAYRRRFREHYHIYPRTGFSPIVEALETRLRGESVSLLTGAHVRQLTFRKGNGPVTLDLEIAEDGVMRRSELETGLLIMPTRVEVDRAVIGSEILDLARPGTTTTTVRLRVSTEGPSRYSYAHARKHPIVRRAHNHSLQLAARGLLANGEEIHLVNLAGGGRVVPPADHILCALRDLRLAHPSAAILDADQSQRVLAAATTDVLQPVRRFARRSLACLWTRDMSRAFGLHRERWSESIEPFTEIE